MLQLTAARPHARMAAARTVLLTASALAALSCALAHVTIKPDVVSVGGEYFRAALRVPHGCGQGEDEDRVYYPVFKV